MKGHPGRMERLRGTALTSAEQAHQGLRTGGRMGTQRANRSSYKSQFERPGAGTAAAPEPFNGRMKKGGVYKARRGEPQDVGPRKSSSQRLNRAGENGQHGRTVRSGITHRTVDVID